jgi:hypothetical protein
MLRGGAGRVEVEMELVNRSNSGWRRVTVICELGE